MVKAISSVKINPNLRVDIRQLPDACAEISQIAYNGINRFKDRGREKLRKSGKTEKELDAILSPKIPPLNSERAIQHFKDVSCEGVFRTAAHEGYTVRIGRNFVRTNIDLLKKSQALRSTLGDTIVDSLVSVAETVFVHGVDGKQQNAASQRGNSAPIR